MQFKPRRKKIKPIVNDGKNLLLGRIGHLKKQGINQEAEAFDKFYFDSFIVMESMVAMRHSVWVVSNAGRLDFFPNCHHNRAGLKLRDILVLMWP